MKRKNKGSNNFKHLQWLTLSFKSYSFVLDISKKSIWQLRPIQLEMSHWISFIVDIFVLLDTEFSHILGTIGLSSIILLIYCPSDLRSLNKISVHIPTHILDLHPYHRIYLAAIEFDPFFLWYASGYKKTNSGLVMGKLNSNPTVQLIWYIYARLLLNLSNCTIFKSLSLV